MRRVLFCLAVLSGAGLLGLWWLLNPSRPGGFGSIGLDRELQWRARMGLPTQDLGLPPHLST